jgi:hypothetical protein
MDRGGRWQIACAQSWRLLLLTACVGIYPLLLLMMPSSTFSSGSALSAGSSGFCSSDGGVETDGSAHSGGGIDSNGGASGSGGAPCQVVWPAIAAWVMTAGAHGAFLMWLCRPCDGVACGAILILNACAIGSVVWSWVALVGAGFSILGVNDEPAPLRGARMLLLLATAAQISSLAAALAVAVAPVSCVPPGVDLDETGAETPFQEIDTDDEDLEISSRLGLATGSRMGSSASSRAGTDVLTDSHSQRFPTRIAHIAASAPPAADRLTRASGSSNPTDRPPPPPPSVSLVNNALAPPSQRQRDARMSDRVSPPKIIVGGEDTATIGTTAGATSPQTANAEGTRGDASTASSARAKSTSSSQASTPRISPAAFRQPSRAFDPSSATGLIDVALDPEPLRHP